MQVLAHLRGRRAPAAHGQAQLSRDAPGEAESKTARGQRRSAAASAVDAVLHPERVPGDIRLPVAVVMETKRTVAVRVDANAVFPNARRSVEVVSDDVEGQVERPTSDDRPEPEALHHL